MKACVTIQLRLPSFSIRDHLAAEIYISQLLPSPRTVLSLLARGIGELQGLSPETKVNGMRASDLLAWCVERNAYAFVKPLSPLCKSSQMWRVRYIEKGWLDDMRRLSDAVQAELVSLSKLGIYYLIDREGLNRDLEEHLKDGITSTSLGQQELIKALSFCQRLTNTESLASLERQPTLLSVRKVEQEGILHSYVPLKWLESDTLVERIVEELYVNLLLADKYVMPTENAFRKSRQKKDKFVLPLRKKEQLEGKKAPRFLWYDPYEPKVRMKNGYALAHLEDGASIPIPRDWL